MKARNSLALVALALALGLGAACSKAPNDSQIIGDVINKVQADQNVATKQIAVQSNKGVVTLGGQVASDAERAAIANDAAQVPGVKTVVNNLTVAPAQAATATPAPEPTPQQKPEAAREAKTERHHAHHTASTASDKNDNSDMVNYAPPPADNSTTAMNNTPPAPVTPPPPPKPVSVTIPDGTQLSIRLIDGLDSEKSQVGDRFRATLNRPIMVGDTVAIPSGTDVEGRVTDVKGAGHFTGQSVLAVELTGVHMGGKTYEVHTQEYRKVGTARGKNTAEKVGGGAALGALIGAIAGGGKGAAIGGALGAGAGGGVQAATHGQQIQLPTESVLSFKLIGPLTVTPAPGRDSDRQQMSDVNN